jgi:hypothetical protein
MTLPMFCFWQESRGARLDDSSSRMASVMAGAFGALDDISSQGSSACSTPRTYQSNGYDGLSDFDEDDFACPGPSSNVGAAVAPPATPGMAREPGSASQLHPVLASRPTGAPQGSAPAKAANPVSTIESALRQLDCDSEED